MDDTIPNEGRQGRHAEKRQKKSTSSSVIIVFVIPILYLLTMGPFFYFVEWRYGSRGEMPGAALELVATPALHIADVVPVYRSYLHACTRRATDRAVRVGAEEWNERHGGPDEK